MDTAWSLPDRPLSVKEISAEANKFQYNDSISLKHWLRAADTLIRQASDLPSVRLAPYANITLGRRLRS